MGSSFDDFYNELPEDVRQRVEAGVKEELEKIEEYRKNYKETKDSLEDIKEFRKNYKETKDMLDNVKTNRREC